MPIQEVPADWSNYFPNWVEWSVTMGALSGIFIVITLFSKLFPMMAIWEVEEGVILDQDKKLAEEIRLKRELGQAGFADTKTHPVAPVIN